MGFKELARKLDCLSHKIVPRTIEKQLLSICRKMNVKPRVVRDWLEAISISPVIQKIEIGNLKGVGEKT